MDPNELQAAAEALDQLRQGGSVSAETLRKLDKSAAAYQATLDANLKKLGTSILGTAKALKDGQQGASVFNSNIESAADAIQAFASKFGVLGKVLGAVVTAGARYAVEVNKQSDALFDVYKNLSQSGLSDAGGMRNIFDNMQKFGYGIEQLGEMTALLKANSKELAAFGGTAASGTKAFADAAGEIQRSGVGKSLQMLGKTPDDINKGIAGFIKQQQMIGVSSASIQQNLAQRSAEYVKNLDLMSKLTGESADQLQAKLEQAQIEDAFAATQYELKKQADAGDINARMKYAANQELAQRLTGTALKEFQQGVGGDIAAMSKTLQTAPEAVTTLTKSAYTADEYITKLGQGAERSMNAFSGIARFNATNDFLLPFNEMGMAASRYAKDTSEQQKERARAEQELQQKGLEPATESQVRMRIEQMKTRDSFQSLINKGINPVTDGMSKLAGGIETMTNKLPGTTTATGTQIGGGTTSSSGVSPGVVPGKSVTIGDQVRTGGDRNWRNNNPGNIEYGPFAIKYGAIGSDGRFAIFPSEQQGRMAQDALLKSKNYANLSLSDAIKRYAPSNENDPKSYANQIMKSTGLDLSRPYASLSSAEQGKVLDAMRQIEGGRAGTISGPAGGYASQLDKVNPGSSLPPKETANAGADVLGGRDQSDDIQQRLLEALEKSNKLNQEVADNTKKTALYAGA
jgi:hypothetical protein